MTKDDFIYALKTCEFTVHNGQVMYAEEDLIKRFDGLPSVTQKSGKWLYKEITDDYRVTGQCSECKERRIIDNFCPNCGARMVEPQESEDEDADSD